LNPARTTSFSLTGTFLITGGTRGLGRAISIQFARSGARVIANYLRNSAAAGELKALAEQQQLPIELCRADLTNPEGFRQVEAAVQQAGLPLTGLVHCAATGTHRPFSELTGRHLSWTFGLNVGAFFELVKLLLPGFAPDSSVIAVSSPGASRAVPQYAVVGASKGALESLARHLAVELAPRGIRVNVVAPGAIATEVWNAIPEGAERLADAGRRSPLRRLVTAEEVALAAQFLCSPAASGINGQTLTIDGGTGIAAWC
jgi:NAD(P)-dependent dehydrogenase (short-subunit alcohol dehydrogenase family)